MLECSRKTEGGEEMSANLVRLWLPRRLGVLILALKGLSSPNRAPRNAFGIAGDDDRGRDHARDSSPRAAST